MQLNPHTLELSHISSGQEIQFGLAMTGRAFAFLMEDHKKENPQYPFEKVRMKWSYFGILIICPDYHGRNCVRPYVS